MMTSRAAAALCLLAAAVAPVLARQAPASVTARLLRVTSTADDGSAGTLRWAIESSNATPTQETIAIELRGRASAIALKSALPPVKGPVQIVGAAWKATGEYAVIDGAGYVPGGGAESCPGATPGQSGANVRTMTSPGLQLVDTANVEISGVEVRRFCIGILINRAIGVNIHDNRIAENRGGAGVMLTGDDGQGNPTSTTTIHNAVMRNEFVDNGDGLELTRGAAFNLIADNVFRSTAVNTEPSQGLEILRGNDNIVSGNRFEGYSDGLQINWGDRNYIVANTLTGNTFGLNLTGIGNIVDGNTITGNRIGIVVRPAEPSPVVRLTRNRITGNGQDIRRCEAGGSCDPAMTKGAIVFGVPGLEHDGFVGSRGRGVAPNPSTIQYICPAHAPQCQPAPNQGLSSPAITTALASASDVTVTGTLRGAPTRRYLVELFGNTDPTSAESERFLDSVPASTDASGAATFTMRFNRAHVDGIRSLTATITSDDGATSPLSATYPFKHTPSR
ncbi:MAG TPA: right-handed parallel beta-helix repeat-containing protein [Vicinamibacterales bacterium]